MPKHSPVIAIDGPAASGKGTLARRLADVLDFAYLDTGKLYRAIGLLSGGDEATAIGIARQGIDARDLAHPRLKDDDIGQLASQVAAISEVREGLTAFQKAFAAQPPHDKRGAVLDGRDIGTVICPDADIKLFVTADVEIRAKRRLKELQSVDKDVTYEHVLKDMRERDARDQGRQTAPMLPADDANIVYTSGMNADEAFDYALALIRARLDDA